MTFKFLKTRWINKNFIKALSISLGVLFLTIFLFSIIRSTNFRCDELSLTLLDRIYLINQIMYYKEFGQINSFIEYVPKGMTIELIISIFFNTAKSAIVNANYWNGILLKTSFVSNQFNLTLYLILDFYQNYVWYFVLMNIGFFVLMFFINVILIYFKTTFSVNNQNKDIILFIKEASISFAYSMIIVISFFLFSYVGILAIDFIARLLDMKNFDLMTSIYNVSGSNQIYYNHIPDTYSIAKSQIDFKMFEFNLKIFYVLGIILNLTFIFIYGYILVILFIFPLYILFDWDIKKIRNRLIQTLMLFIFIVIFIFALVCAIMHFQKHYYNNSLYKAISYISIYSIFIIPPLVTIIFIAKHNFTKKG